MPHRRRLIAAAATGAALLLLAGCTPDSGPEPTPSATRATRSATPAQSSATPTPSPTATSPTRPAAMGTNDEAGAVAAAEYFLSDLYDYMYVSGDTTEWAALAADDCSFCNSVLSDVESMKTANHSDTGSAVEVTASRGAAINRGESYSVWVTAAQSPSQRRDAHGAVVTEDAGGTYDLFLAVWWIDGWVIRGVDVLATHGEPSP
ncbi:DUF6318 family protein [Cellulomonas sp. 179-A 9B4 NHS]|uniref:DUF6318 family protein n=1 Tax=Cellulomonas sp. 179-A 9B4 NHS TaxID=3142379 RepID=UPI0039A39485